MLHRIITNFTAVAFVAAAALFGTAANAIPVPLAAATTSFTNMTLTGLTASDHFFFSDASTPFESGFFADSVLTPVSFNTSNANGVSVAQIDNDFGTIAQTHAAAERNGEGHATVLWSFFWTATSTGTAAISLDALFATTVANLLPGNHGYARSYASVGLDGTNLFDSALYYLNDVPGDPFDFRTLGFSFDVIKGQTGAFTMTLNSDAVTTVPEPTTLPLLCSALAGLLLIRRYRRTA